MSNYSATIAVGISYTSPGGASVSVPGGITVVCPYRTQNVGDFDVPNGTAADVEYEVPFGNVTTGATCVVLQNNTSQPLKVKINGAASPSHDMEVGGLAVIAEATLPPGTPVTAVSVTTTEEADAAGTVVYYVFGDPT